MPSRPLKESEVAFARQVFGDQVPYDKVSLSRSFFPFNGKTRTPVTAASFSTFVPVRTLRSYTIFFGPDAFDQGADSPGLGHTFIHELTHVWQGFHGVLGWEYMAQSMLAQGYAILTQGNRNRAYDYQPGVPWGSYNVEQQAYLVEHWYQNGMKQDDVRYPYITDHIRAGRK